MKVDERPTEQYRDIGGLDKQIQARARGGHRSSIAPQASFPTSRNTASKRVLQI